MEIHFELPVERARATVRASGRVAGVCYRPWMEGGAFLIAAHINW